jgi:hypothetical protein
MSQVMTASKWQAIRERFESSGLSQVAFCNRERISAASFSYWKRKFSAGSVAISPLRSAASACPKFVEIDFESLTGSVSPRNEEADLVVELPLGVRLRFRVQACA